MDEANTEPKIPEWIRVLQDLIRDSKKTKPDEDSDNRANRLSPMRRP